MPTWKESQVRAVNSVVESLKDAAAGKEITVSTAEDETTIVLSGFGWEAHLVLAKFQGD